MIKKILISLVISTSIMLGSNNLQLNINSDTLELYGEYSINQAYNLNDDAGYSISLSYLGSDDTALTSQSSDKQINLGLKIMNPYINDYGFSYGLGINLVWLDNSPDSFMALPLGFYTKYELNNSVSFDGFVVYAPKVLSFSDAKSYQAFNFKANYKIIDNGYVYIGLRNIKTKYKNNQTLKFDDKLFFGYKVQF